MVAAITDLCPGLQPELDAARRGFTDGDFTIGAAAPKEGGGSISAGKYEAWNPSPNCTLVAYDAAGGAIARIERYVGLHHPGRHRPRRVGRMLHLAGGMKPRRFAWNAATTARERTRNGRP